MKYLILLIFLIGCHDNEDNYVHHKSYDYRQKITVTGGFYKGCTGEVVMDQGERFNDMRLDLTCTVNGTTHFVETYYLKEYIE